MRMIRCKDCGRRYDYDKDDFCPKCGAYNPPAEGRATQLEQELLSRFDSQRSRQKAPAARRPAQAKQAPRGPRTVDYHPTYGGGPEVSGTAHSARIQGCAACETPERRHRSGGAAVFLAVLVCIIAVVAVVTALNLLSFDDPFERLSGINHSVAVPEPDVSPALALHQMEESFQVNDVEISIDECWWVGLSDRLQADREGYECLAVQVWITGGARQDDLYIDTPSILLNGVEYPLEDDLLFSRRLQEEAGLYCVNLRDYQWEDPLSGQFIFLLPQDSAGELALLIREYAPGQTDSPVLTATHHIPLDA